ncbi:MAG: glutathione-regulated potassium-efflux system ancillary protein KefF [Myxococcales bacterium]|nr:MAG: glutathione-regulated potassium-efflux system ancillary protein KefF [Myxococcales bacterium]
MLLLVFAHPYPDRSRANLALLRAVEDVEGVEVRSLYDLYPAFDIDVPAEQEALARARVVIWQHPIYWYAPPSLLKHWFDKVLLRGWAYGEGGDALRGKRCLWVATTGGEPAAYGPDGMHRLPFSHYVPPVEQTARFCQMGWEEPIIVQGSHRLSDEELAAMGREYRRRLEQLRRDVEAAS